MTDIFTKRKRSEVMSRIRGTRNKSTELKLIQIFRANNITGWRRGSKLPGKPDFVFPGLKTTVFVDGCFWHGCPRHGLHTRAAFKSIEKLTAKAAYWVAKLTRNKARDRRTNRVLRSRGWVVLRIWEHELATKNLPRLLRRLHKLASLGGG